MSDGPILLVVGQKINAAPNGHHASKVAGDHAAACRVEPYEHNWIGVGLGFLLRRLRLLVPDSNPTYINSKVPLSQPIARIGLNGCHSMQVGVILLESSY